MTYVASFVKVISITGLRFSTQFMGDSSTDTADSLSGTDKGCIVSSALGRMMMQADARMNLGPASNICMFGTCDFAIAGDVIMDVADSMSSIPVPMLYDLRIPGWVDDGTVAIVMTDSSEDSRIIIESLFRRGCMTVVIAPEGVMFDNFPGVFVVRIPDSCDAVGRIGFCIGTLAAIMSETGIIDMSEVLRMSSDEIKSYFTDDGRVADIVEILSGNVPAIYSTSDIHACSKWWKHVLGDCAQDLSFFGELPEFDHNELVGWSDPNVHAPELRMVVLRSGSESKIVLDIVSCMVEVLDENGRRATVVDLGGGSTLAIDLKGILLGSMVAHRLKEAA